MCPTDFCNVNYKLETSVSEWVNEIAAVYFWTVFIKRFLDMSWCDELHLYRKYVNKITQWHNIKADNNCDVWLSRNNQQDATLY
jgi:hypothetical protein